MFEAEAKKGKARAQTSAHNISENKLHPPFLKEKGGKQLY